MPAYYVELARTVSFGSEVEADSAEEAQDKVLTLADGDPRDWTITVTQEVKQFGVDEGAIALR